MPTIKDIIQKYFGWGKYRPMGRLSGISTSEPKVRYSHSGDIVSIFGPVNGGRDFVAIDPHNGEMWVYNKWVRVREDPKEDPKENKRIVL
jgi:hypothetical protein